MLDYGERAPPCGSAVTRAAATRWLDDGERAPPGGSAEARAAATGGLDDGKCAPFDGSVASEPIAICCRWSQIGGASQSVSWAQLPGGAGWPAGHRESRRDVWGRARRQERKSWRA